MSPDFVGVIGHQVESAVPPPPPPPPDAARAVPPAITKLVATGSTTDLVNKINSAAAGDVIGIPDGVYDITGNILSNMNSNVVVRPVNLAGVVALAALNGESVGNVRPKVHIKSTGQKLFYQFGSGWKLWDLELSGTSGPNYPQGDSRRDVQNGSLTSQFGVNAEFHYIYYHDCNNHGGGGNEPGVLLEHCELARCGSSEWTGTSAGGFKSANDFVARYNFAHDCVGNGIWADVDGLVTSRWNIIVDNYRGGTRQEHGDGYCTTAPAYIEDNLLGGNNWAGVAANSGDAGVNSTRNTSVRRNKAVRTIRTNYNRTTTGAAEGEIQGEITALAVGQNSRSIQINGQPATLQEGRMVLDVSGSRGCPTSNCLDTVVADNYLCGGQVDVCGHGGSTCSGNLSSCAAITAPPSPSPAPTPPPPPPPTGIYTIAAAADICPPFADSTYQYTQTSNMIVADSTINAVLAMGDNNYESGLLSEYQNQYQPTWGRFKSMTYPVPGNHEYNSGSMTNHYEAYWGRRCSPRAAGKYSYAVDAGGWHLLFLDSDIQHRGAGAAAEQLTWMDSILASWDQDGVPILCCMHHNRFSNGGSAAHPADSAIGAFYTRLYAARCDIIIHGHNHYADFSPRINASGVLDPEGYRVFCVGTGGHPPDNFGTVNFPTDYKSLNRGVGKLYLEASRYEFRFYPIGQSAAAYTTGLVDTHK